MRLRPPRELRWMLRLMDLYADAHDPRYSGWEHLPAERPLLFVGNHTMGGFYDVPLFFRELWRRERIFLRALGDRIHFRVPLWRRTLERYGVVEGSPDNCARLFEAGACVLVFPGGAREVSKRRGEEHQLIWQRRAGFARLALRHGVTIVPFAAVGVEDALDIVWDADDMARGPLGRVLDAVGLREDLRMPVVRGMGPTPIPRAERFDFHICSPIPTRGVEDPGSEEAAWAVREQTRIAIEDAIAHLRATREA